MSSWHFAPAAAALLFTCTDPCLVETGLGMLPAMLSGVSAAFLVVSAGISP